MMPLEALIARLDACVWRLGRGELIGSEELHTLADTAMALGPSLEESDRIRLSDRVGRVCEALEQGQRNIEERLRQLRQGRRAVRAYGEPTAMPARKAG